MEGRLYRRNNSKLDINILKEIGYILLLITFFIGILGGSLSFKNVSNFEEYKAELKENIVSNQEESSVQAKVTSIQGIKTIVIFWIVGMSIIGIPILIAFIGYKGYSLGYTISTVIKTFGTSEGNKYIFQNLFIRNVFLVFIMIFLANYSIKIFRNFFENRENLKVDAIKYTIISTFMCIVFMLVCMVENVIL